MDNAETRLKNKLDLKIGFIMDNAETRLKNKLDLKIGFHALFVFG